MKHRIAAGLGLFLSLAACGSETGTQPEALGCNPFGTWELTYEPLDERDCERSPEQIVVSQGPGVPVAVRIGRVPASAAGSNRASFFETECTLLASNDASWTNPGPESDSDRRILSLTMNGDEAVGLLDFRSVWGACSFEGSEPSHHYRVTARRVE